MKVYKFLNTSILCSRFTHLRNWTIQIDKSHYKYLWDICRNSALPEKTNNEKNLIELSTYIHWQQCQSRLWFSSSSKGKIEFVYYSVSFLAQSFVTFQYSNIRWPHSEVGEVQLILYDCSSSITIGSPHFLISHSSVPQSSCILHCGQWYQTSIGIKHFLHGYGDAIFVPAFPANCSLA